MKASPFLIGDDGSGTALQAIERRQKAYDEAWLQGLLRQHPDILPVAEIEPIYHPLLSIGCEVSTATGSIDNLFISPRGYLVLVETKLWRNPQARREVVAQAIDYASSLSQWSYSQLDEAVRGYLQAYEGVDLDLLGWVEEHHGPVEGGRYFFEETVAKNLRLGRFLTVIVGDRIRRSLVDMLNHVNRYPHLATDVALVELHCYRWRREDDWPLLVVPSVVARTEIIERSVIQVTVKPDGDHQVDVKQQRVAERDRGRRRVLKSEEAFWELLGQQASQDYEELRRLIETFREVEGVTIDPTDTGVVARFDIPYADTQVSVFFVRPDGRLEVWPGSTVVPQVERAGIDPQLARRYRERMRGIMDMPEDRKDFGQHVTNVDVEAFIAAAAEFIEDVRSAAGDL